MINQLYFKPIYIIQYDNNIFNLEFGYDYFIT